MNSGKAFLSIGLLHRQFWNVKVNKISLRHKTKSILRPIWNIKICDPRASAVTVGFQPF
jgi:hypothetical protein